MDGTAGTASAIAAGGVHVLAIRTPECADGLDNDGDALTDYPDDPGCTSAVDFSERDSLCPSAPEVRCTPGFVKASLTVNEKKAGKERLTAKLAKGPALSRADFGDPTVANGTAVALCLYDDAGTLVEPLEMDRAGASCGPRPCWKPIGKRSPDGEGFAYKDPAGSTYGVRSMQLQGGAAGRASLSLAASNNVKRDRTAPLPTGIAAALSTTAEVTLQVHTSDAGCFGATLTDITKQKSDQFKAR